MTKARSNATANAAKGDLTVGNGTNLSGVLGVGSNGDTIVADSSTSTGLRWQGNYAAGKNGFLNADCRISQRGTTFTNAADGAYTLDRFQFFKDGTASVNVTQETFTPGTAPVAGYEGSNYLRLTPSSYTSGNIGIRQNIEDVRTFAGQTVTISFWAKASASTSNTILYLQNFGSGGSGSVNASAGSVTITTSWARYSVTVAIPSVSGKTIGTSSFLQIQLLRYAANSTVDIWGTQIEIGSVATAFETATGTIQGELAACQRYFLQIASGNTVPIGFAYFDTTSLLRGNYTMPVTMRTTPTIVQTTGTNYYFTNDGGGFTSISLVSCSPNVLFWFNSGVSGTLNRTQPISTGNASSFLGFQAEL